MTDLTETSTTDQTASPRLLIFLFTDLVDSTGLKERWGDMDYVRCVLQPHNRLFRETLRQFPSGVERDNAGDGFLSRSKVSRRRCGSPSYSSIGYTAPHGSAQLLRPESASIWAMRPNFERSASPKPKPQVKLRTSQRDSWGLRADAKFF